ncbi:MAG: biotin transporter BioY [Pseudomonadota bacterium]
MNAKKVMLAVIAAALIGVAAQITLAVPGVALPITLQTAVVLVAGAALGANAGGLAVVVYLMMGVLGLPVFSDGQSGGGVLFSPSGGYLLGFWFAAVVVGLGSDTGWLWRSPLLLPLWMVGAHVLILLFGAGLLSFSLGVTAAWFNGVAPFLVGGLVKSLLAAVLAFPCYRLAYAFTRHQGEVQREQEPEQNR